jgi:hypothetical protein
VLGVKLTWQEPVASSAQTSGFPDAGVIANVPVLGLELNETVPVGVVPAVVVSVTVTVHVAGCPAISGGETAEHETSVDVASAAATAGVSSEMDERASERTQMTSARAIVYSGITSWCRSRRSREGCGSR